MPVNRYAALVLLAASTGALAQPADRIWSGGPILTMNDKAMRAEAIAEAGGRIVAVGTKADVMKLQGPRTQVIDLKGQTLVPGFVDPHGHLAIGGIQALSANVLAPPDGKVTDIPSLIATLKAWTEANRPAAEKVNLIIGFGYDNSQLKEQRHPTKEELDQVSATIPVMIIHQSSHLATLNSAALKRVGIDASTKDPTGGVIQRMPGSTEPNGTLEEVAFFGAVPGLMANLGAGSFETFVREGTKLWTRYGYTTAQEARAVPAVANAIRKVADEGGLAVDVVAYVDMLVDRDYVKANASREYRNRFRLAGAKLTIDGAVQGFTGWRDRPYYKPVGNFPPGYSGYPAASEQQVMEAVDWAYANDIQIITHANGEKASALLIDALTAAQAKHGKADQRPVLIHGQLESDDQPAKFVKLGVVPSLFPMHTFYWGDWHYEATVGPERAQVISPTGWYRQLGSIFTTHHDAPVAFPDSMRVLDATVNRTTRSGRVLGPEQRVDAYTGLRAMTIWPAYQIFEEATKGSLEPGKLADFAILSRDPTTGDPTTIDTIKVTETVKEGKTIFRLQPGEQAEATPANIAPLLNLLAASGAAGGHAHSHGDGDACPGDATVNLAAMLGKE